MVKCAICGVITPDEENLQFCSGCGAKFPEVVSSPPEPQQPEPQQPEPQQPEPQSSELKQLEPRGGFLALEPWHTGITNTIFFEDTPTTFGRSDSSNLIESAEDNAKVSRKQFTMFKKSDKCYIEDGVTSVQEKPSSNHTKVNGKDITEKGAIELHDGDQIEIALIYTFSFSNPAGTPSNSPPPPPSNSPPPSNNNQTNDDIVNKYDNMPEL